MPEVRIFGNANKSFKNFESAANKYRNFTSSMTAKIRPGFVSFRVFILSVATFIVPMGIYLIVRNHNDIDIITTFILFLIAAPAISVPCLKLRDFAEGMNLLEEVIQRVWDIIVEKEIVEGEYSAELKNYDIEFEDVGFAYEKDQVLKNINFKAKQGEVTALVGPSGAGKSTIGVLIPRFYEPTDGTIKIGGIDIKEMTFNYLMENISFVFQDNDLISDTIFNNIAMAKKDCKKEDVIEAAKKAISSPLLETSIVGAKGVLLNITGGPSLSLFEAQAAASIVQEASDDEVNMIFGTVFNDELEKTDEIIVTVIATGFEEDGVSVERDILAQRPAQPEASSFTSGYGKNEVEQEMYPRPRRRTRREI